MSGDPFACSWLIESEQRDATVVLEANPTHRNTGRGPRVQRAVFRNDLTPDRALELCLTIDGEVDIVTEVSPADAARVQASTHAKLVAADANRVLLGIVNRAPRDVPLDDADVRRALNYAVDRRRVVEEGFAGHATALSALTPPWCSGFPANAEPYPYDPAQARALLGDRWPSERALRLATPEAFAGIAQLVAGDVRAALGIPVEVMVVPEAAMPAGARALVEGKLALPWDVLLFGWFDLSSEAPPAAVHREFFGRDGAFRAGPELPEFNRLFDDMRVQLDGKRLVEVAERIDRHVRDEALALFLCAPQALYAVNNSVDFGPYRTTFEIAEVTVAEDHWSRTAGGGSATPTGTGDGSAVTDGAAMGGTAGYGAGAETAGDAAQAKPGFSGAAGNAC